MYNGVDYLIVIIEFVYLFRYLLPEEENAVVRDIWVYGFIKF